MASNTEPPHLTEVDGVSCLWAESRGPDIFAALLFRVGVADESMRAGGVSHLVEHLALPSSPISGIDLNGTVDMLTTHFWGQGQPEPALDLIAQIAASLADPPLARLPRERSILKAEAAQRPSSHWHNALSLRYGPVAHGLGIYEEYGVTAATDEQVAEWAATRFTKGNAILYLTGPPPGPRASPAGGGTHTASFAEAHPVRRLPVGLPDRTGGMRCRQPRRRSLCCGGDGDQHRCPAPPSPAARRIRDDLPRVVGHERPSTAT